MSIYTDNLPDLSQGYVVVDCETSGLTPSVDHIIELSALVYQDGKVTTRTNLIKALPVVPHEISEITGITTAMINADGEPPAEVLAKFLDMPEVQTLPIVGHNFIAFDRLFLLHNINRHLGAVGFERANKILHPSRLIDTGALYKGMVMESPPLEGESHAAWADRVMQARRKGLQWNLAMASKRMAVRQQSEATHRARADVMLCHLLFQKILEA